MIKTISLKIYQNDKMIESAESIRCINRDSYIVFNHNDVTNKINKDKYIRENNDYQIEFDINEKKGLLLLKKEQLKFDLPIDKLSYQEDNKIILISKLKDDKDTTKLEIEIKEVS